MDIFMGEKSHKSSRGMKKALDPTQELQQPAVRECETSEPGTGSEKRQKYMGKSW